MPELREVLVHDGDKQFSAWFHGWGQEAIFGFTDNALDVRYTHTVAIVEDGDGNVSTHVPVKIQFVHGPPAKY